MKIICFVILFIVCKISMAQTQSPVSVVTSVSRVRLDTNQVVYDEQGKPLRYYQYNKLMMSGEYSLRTDGDPSLPTTKRFLRKLTADDQSQLMELRKRFMTINSPALREGKELDLSLLAREVKKTYVAQKLIILIFWKTDCPPCTESFETFNNMLKQVSANDALVIAISPNGKKEASATLKEKPLLYAQMAYNDQEAINGYGITQYPSYVIADKNRIIKLAINGIGPQTIPLIQSTLQSLLKP